MKKRTDKMHISEINTTFAPKLVEFIFNNSQANPFSIKDSAHKSSTFMWYNLHTRNICQILTNLI